MYNVVKTLALSFLIGSSSVLQVTRTTIKSRTSSKFGPVGLRTADLPALERLGKSPLTYNGKNVLPFSPSFLIEPSSILQVTRTCITSYMSSNIGQIPPLTSELSAIERLKKRFIIL